MRGEERVRPRLIDVCDQGQMRRESIRQRFEREGWLMDPGELSDSCIDEIAALVDASRIGG